MKKRIEFDNGDYYVGESSKGKPSGFGTYFLTGFGLSFQAIWDKEKGPLFETIKVDNPTGRRFLFLFEDSGAVYRICHLLAVFEVRAGDIAYSGMHQIFEIMYPSNRVFKIRLATEEEVEYEVNGLFQKGGEAIVDSIRLGEKKAYEDRFDNFTVYADEEVEFTEHYRLELLLA